MQKTDFPIEILIHDDCSTDGTTEIIREYEAKYPDLIFPLYEEENQYQQGKAAEIDFYNYRRARGKYIAYCEGDDYWTDPLKLQKQVDFMEAYPEYSVCFHDFQVYDLRNERWSKPIYNVNISLVDGGVDITLEMYLRNSNYGRPLTMLFRVSNFNYQWQKNYRYYRDTHEIYHLLCEGKGKFMDFIGGVYNMHDGGVSSSIKLSTSALVVRETYKELYKCSLQDKIIKKFMFETLLWNNDIISKKEFVIILRDYFFIMPTIVMKVLYTIIKRKIKSIQLSNTISNSH
jgi:glycosyltransferase involved in cell wall biosynthesis